MLKVRGTEYEGVSFPLFALGDFSSSKDASALTPAPSGHIVLGPASMRYRMPLSLHLKAGSGFLLLCISELPSYPFRGSQLPHHLYSQFPELNSCRCIYLKQFLFFSLDLDL